MKNIRWNMLLGAGSLLLSAAILLGDAGWIPHGLKLFLMGLACALELWGVSRRCREKREEEPVKKVQTVSLLLLVLTLAVMAVNGVAVPLPDWAVRIDGAVMMLAIAAVVFSTVRQSMENK